MSDTVQISNDHVCAYAEELPAKYVFYTGGVAGMSDHSDLKGDAESLDCGADKIEL